MSNATVEPAPGDAQPAAADMAAAPPPPKPVPAPARWQISLRGSLVALVACCVAPALLVSAVLVFKDHRLQQDRVYRNTVLLARNLAGSLDRELAGMESALQVLATAPELQSDDLAGFHRRARDAMHFQDGQNFVLVDHEGRELVHTARAVGQSSAPGSMPRSFGRVFHTRQSTVTGLYPSRESRRQVMALVVPVHRGEEVRYGLGMELAPSLLSSLLGSQSLPEGWYANVTDPRGVILARTLDPQRHVGQPVGEALQARMLTQNEGTLAGQSREGVPVFFAFSRSAIADWSVAVAAPQAEISGEVARSSLWLATGALLTLGLGLWMALALSRRIRRSVQGLIEPALALGSGQPVRLPPTRLAEAAAVGQALVQASQMLAQARHQAHHDPLTGLCNRLLFDELVARQLNVARRQGLPLAVLALDLDSFKEVNDLQGHAVGDLVLKFVAERITAAVRASDVVARIGGDEFVVLLANTDLDSARLVADKLVGALAAPYPGVRPAVSASVGIAMYPEAGDDIAELLRHADAALYRAKSAGRQRAAVWT